MPYVVDHVVSHVSVFCCCFLFFVSLIFTFHSDTPSLGGQLQHAQIFVGHDSLVTDIYGIKTDKMFVDTLEDNIRQRGAMDKLLSDRAQSEVSQRVADILRNYCIGDWQSQPQHQHQNPAERRYQTVKNATNRVMNRSGCPAKCWLLVVLYVVFVLNRLATHSLGWRTPLEVLDGQTPDISPLLQFEFYEPVYYAVDAALETPKKMRFPSETHERKGYFVGIAENIGDHMTYKILTEDTEKVIFRSSVCSALSVEERNRRVDTTDGEEKPIREFVTGSRPSPLQLHPIDDDIRGIDPENLPDAFAPNHLPDDYVGRSFLTQPTDDGERFRAKVKQKLVQVQDPGEKESPSNVKFLVTVDG